MPSSMWDCATINISLGFQRGIPSIHSAIESAINFDMVVFAAACNDGSSSGLSDPAWH